MTAINPTAPADRPRFLSEADCRDIAQRLARFSAGGGETVVHIVSQWAGNVRWGRNRITTTGEDRDNQILVTRIIQGATGAVTINTVTDAALIAAARQAERLAHLKNERVATDLVTRPDSPWREHPERIESQNLFVDGTYQLTARARAGLARHVMQSAISAGMYSAGYLQVSATSFAEITTWGASQYYQYTWAQCSLTIRDPEGSGSGWAGVDWPDWSKIDGDALATRALDKCLASRHPVSLEPGRYTTILEPQAVCDFIGPWMFEGGIGRRAAEENPNSPFHKPGHVGPLGLSRLGEQVLDKRITIRSDPLDPDLGFPPIPKAYGFWGESLDRDVFHPATWIDRGVLTAAAYDRKYALELLNKDAGLPNAGAFRMDGGDSTLDAMIANTIRGLLVTRFDQVDGFYTNAMLARGYTRDGLWLIEHGKITKAVNNMLFTESLLFALNNVEEIGPAQRVFHPLLSYKQAQWTMDPQPVITPPLKIRDFSFTALSNAI